MWHKGKVGVAGSTARATNKHTDGPTSAHQEGGVCVCVRVVACMCVFDKADMAYR